MGLTTLHLNRQVTARLWDAACSARQPHGRPAYAGSAYINNKVFV
jgi:hypothetical protein